MYIIAIAWIYVVLLMSFTEESIVAGVATFLFYGLAPLSVLLYLMGTPQRRRNRRRREALSRESDQRTTGQEAPAGISTAPPETGAPDGITDRPVEPGPVVPTRAEPRS